MRESGGVRVGQDAGHKRAQAPLVLRGGLRLRRRRADERADAAARFEHAGAFELRVDAGDRVGVDAKFDGQLPDGRQLVAEPSDGPVAIAARSPRSSCA